MRRCCHCTLLVSCADLLLYEITCRALLEVIKLQEWNNARLHTYAVAAGPSVRIQTAQ